MRLERWALKKLGRYGVALGSGVRDIVGRGRRPSVHVLMYHRFRQAARDAFSVTPETFARQVEWLARSRLAISLPRLRELIMGQLPLEGPAVLVTVDDGYRDLYTAALPILRRYGVPAVAFVSVGCMEERDGPPLGEAADAYLSWRELQDLVAGGIAVASHGWNHVSLAGLDPGEMSRQVGKSRAELERRLGITVDAFAYPFGTRRDFSPATERALGDAGYALAFTAQHGPVTSGANRFALARVKVEGGEGMWMFRRAVAGGLDGWAAVDRLLWRLQARERAYARL